MATREWPRLKLGKDPGRSFYLAVNEHWLKSHELPGWKSEYSVSDEITDKTNKELLGIFHSLPNVKPTNLIPHTPNQHLQLLGYIWKNKNAKSEEDYLQVCLHQLMEFEGDSNIATFLGWMIRSSIPTAINFSVGRELDPPFLIRTTLSPGRLLLPLEYYSETHIKNSGVWTAYEQFISICSVELGLPFLHRAIEAENALSKILSKSSLHLAQSKKAKLWKSLMPNFEWQAFMNGLDVDVGWERRIWAIIYPETFKAILNWFCSAEKELVVSLMAMHVIRFAAPYLRPVIKEAYYKLFHNALLGVTNAPSKEQSMLHQIKAVLPDALCNLYSKHHYDSNIIKNISQLVSILKYAAIDYMKHSSLLANKTRSKIIEKLHRMKFIIGNSRPTSISRVTYNLDSFLHTICSINSARNKSNIRLTGKTLDKVHSEYPCYITNASYFQDSNTIFLPWGILEYPFYSSNTKTPLGWNHGGIGATICHEIMHAFDLEGSLYTPTGQFKETWTRKNRIKFKRETRRVSEFFGKFKHFGKKIDGKKSLSENWADLGGLKISLHSLNRELSKNDASDAEKREAYRYFFISYATSWSTLTTKKALMYSMRESIHAPAEDRVDRIVPQFQEWVDAFDIKEDDPLYLAPEKRLKFF
jgi:predicted metalloendopeptidase